MKANPNWAGMIEALVSKGIKQTEIAKRCGVSNSCISELKSGVLKDMHWRNGQALIDLFIETLSSNHH